MPSNPTEEEKSVKDMSFNIDRLFGRVGPHIRLEWSDTAPAAMNSNDPRLWDILAEKERDFSWSLRLPMLTLPSYCLRYPMICLIISRARKTKGYKGVLTKMRERGLAPVIEQPILVQPECQGSDIFEFCLYARRDVCA